MEPAPPENGSKASPQANHSTSNLVYEPLDNKRREIRLLEISPASDDNSMVEARLFPTALAKAPKYMALSYVWGDPSVTESISINGQVSRVTTNLASALRQFRRVPHFLWVDAISINQKDTEERSDQVKFMASIYEEANLVLASLGPENSTISLAINLLNALGSGLQKFSHRKDIEWTSKISGLWDENEMGYLGWSAIRSFLNLEYWTRIWIVQEMVFAKRLWFASGSKVTTWNNLMVGFELHQQILKGEVPVPHFVTPTSMGWRTVTKLGYFNWRTLVMVDIIKKLGKELLHLARLHLAHITCYLQATDPRDMVYATLGMFLGNMEPDYSAAVRDVYCEYARRWIDSNRGLELLGESGLGYEIVDGFGLPSWIPNWHGISQINIPPFLYPNGDMYEANRNLGEADTRFTAVDDDFNLHAQGLVHDYVHDVEPQLSTGSRLQLYSLCCRYISRTKAFTSRVYLSPLQALFRTLLMDIDVHGDGRLYENTDSVVEQAVRFLNLVILSSDELERDNLSSLESLGISLGSDFSHSFSKQFSIDTTCDPHLLSAKSIYDVCLLNSNYGSTDSVLAHVFLSLGQRRLFYGARGDLGIAPPGILKGDLICVLTDCNFPVVLRKVDSHFVYVGPCFMLGIMDGEAAEMVKDGKAEIQTFEIR